MTMSTYTISENRIKQILKKYDNKIAVGDYLAIIDCLKEMDRIKSQLGKELQDCVNNSLERNDEDRKEEAIKHKMTFIEKIKFLFKK